MFHIAKTKRLPPSAVHHIELQLRAWVRKYSCGRIRLPWIGLDWTGCFNNCFRCRRCYVGSARSPFCRALSLHQAADFTYDRPCKPGKLACTVSLASIHTVGTPVAPGLGWAACCSLLAPHCFYAHPPWQSEPVLPQKLNSIQSYPKTSSLCLTLPSTSLLFLSSFSLTSLLTSIFNFNLLLFCPSLHPPPDQSKTSDITSPPRTTTRSP